MEEPPMGIAYIVAYLKRFEWIDLTVPFISCSSNNPPLENLLSEKQYDVVCTGGMFVYHRFYMKFFELARKYQKNALKVLGGPIVGALNYDELFRYLNIDIAIKGEGENTLLTLLKELYENQYFTSEINGLIYKNEKNEIIITKEALPIDLDELNINPDWSWYEYSEVLQKKYSENERHKFNRMPILASRGCPNKCDFCHSPFSKVRKRTVEDIINEIKYLKSTYKNDRLVFMDETFTANSRRMIELCETLIKEKINVQWSCGVRTNLINLEVLHLMKRAGCEAIQLGIESGSQDVLNRMNKNTTIENNLNAVILIRKAKIRPMISVMFGYEDETYEELQSTIDFLIEVNELPEYMSHTTPVPGAPLYDRTLKKGLINVNNTYEYIDNMNAGIYLTKRPFLNLTKIPNNIYWQTLLEAKQRLYTTLAHNNKAIIIEESVVLEDTRLNLKIECPHCNCIKNISQKFRWISKHFCTKCDRYMWLHLNNVSFLKRSYLDIENMINNTIHSKKEIVVKAITPEGMQNLYSIFYHVPWKKLWQNVVYVNSLHTFLYFESINMNSTEYTIFDIDNFSYVSGYQQC
ncbi:B12-binding domain-containing radical SAM protein [Aliarcobacter cryaerophilus]|uniref:B12-binding domain-containing radical SAM protein n=1 Tax=Aliarcobacter cryaerophilus TaxID=28198 RepID=UPI0021B602D5|nr:radical SAM protein [Aliarcobacter cryaerophilus]MCT7516356.1 B12-binding domain-containing radical SAM protein [Aliarcobacter cryaerophilus]